MAASLTYRISKAGKKRRGGVETVIVAALEILILAGDTAMFAGYPPAKSKLPRKNPTTIAVVGLRKSICC